LTFSLELCPIAVEYNAKKMKWSRSLFDKGKMDDICRFKDCANFTNCWATKTTQIPVYDLNKKEDAKKFREVMGF